MSAIVHVIVALSTLFQYRDSVKMYRLERAGNPSEGGGTALLKTPDNERQERNPSPPSPLAVGENSEGRKTKGCRHCRLQITALADSD